MTGRCISLTFDASIYALEIITDAFVRASVGHPSKVSARTVFPTSFQTAVMRSRWIRREGKCCSKERSPLALHVVEDIGQPDPGDGSDEQAHAVVLLAKTCALASAPLTSFGGAPDCLGIGRPFQLLCD